MVKVILQICGVNFTPKGDFHHTGEFHPTNLKGEFPPTVLKGELHPTKDDRSLLKGEVHPTDLKG